MKKTVVNPKYSLQTNNNYNESINCEVSDIKHKYLFIINDYLNNIKLNKKENSKFIILRGLETITHVFNMILYFTKNLEITHFYSEKSFYLYIEFINQITDDSNKFLQLCSRDASIYVYKKTIFDINNEYRKNGREECDQKMDETIFKNIVEFTYLIKIIMLYVFEYNILFNEKIITIQQILHSLNNNNKNLTQEITDIICEMSNIKNIIKQTPETYCDNINKLISK
jgi:hypothetical protein